MVVHLATGPGCLFEIAIEQTIAFVDDALEGFRHRFHHTTAETMGQLEMEYLINLNLLNN